MICVPLRSILAAAAMCAALARPAYTQSATANDLAGLPLREIPAAPSATPDSVFAVFITGDGGWASIDVDITAAFASHGVNVIGLDSRAYLRSARTPERVAEDVGRIVRHYQRAWHTTRFALVGYSRGADLAPFIATRLDSTLRADLALIGMVGLGERAGFEFHFQDIFRDVKRPTDKPTLPELERLRGMRMLCVYGEDEKESGCRSAPDGLIEKVKRPGSHHFDGDYQLIADVLLKALRRSDPR